MTITDLKAQMRAIAYQLDQLNLAIHRKPHSTAAHRRAVERIAHKARDAADGRIS